MHNADRPLGKAQIAAQRTERFANRNPRRLESQISDLQSLKESQGGKLSTRDQKQLDELERDVARVKKARETLGDKAPQFGQGRGGHEGSRGRGDSTNGQRRGGRGGYGGLGKRNRDEADESEETDEDVRNIPWPRDTPPPIPRQRNDRPQALSTNANMEPLGPGRERPDRTEETEETQKPDTSLPARPDTGLPAKPAIRTTYESAPQVRDLRKEATARFVPAAVKRKIDATKGVGGRLLEEEEFEKLEKEGYGSATTRPHLSGEGKVSSDNVPLVDAAPNVDSEAALEAKRLKEEEDRFAQEMEAEDISMGYEQEEGATKQARVEEVSDEDL